jgi:surface polysaccharide O-acyltransferase-like enzyme
MIILFLFGIALIAIGSRWLTTYPKYPGTMFYEPVNPAVLMLSASIFLIVKNTAPKVPPVIIRIRDFAGNYNYGIYLAHALILYFLDDLFGISYRLCTPLISIPLTALIAFILSVLLVWLINKIPFVGKWVSG